MKAKLVLLLITLLLMSPQSWCWGQHSHRVICDIAWRNLTETAKQEIRKVLRHTGHKTFANACVWADKVRTIQRYEFTKPHHYINVRESAATIDLQRDCGKQGCVVEAVQEYINILNGMTSKAYINNPQQALLFLGHLLADLHQPLHVAYASDRGGNNTYLRVGDKEVSLHTLWDVSVAEYKLAKSWRKAGRYLAAKIQPVEHKMWSAGTIIDWANESLAMVNVIYGELPEDRVTTTSYFAKNYPLAEKRIQQAGFRLATVINDIYR